MSHSSSQTDLPDPADFSFLGDGPVETPKVDPVGRELGALTQSVRGQITAAMKADGVGVRDLARSLDVSPAAISRFLRSAGDLKISTAVLLAHALGRKWNVELIGAVDSSASDRRNFRVEAPRASLEDDSSRLASTTGAAGGTVTQPANRPIISIVAS